MSVYKFSELKMDSGKRFKFSDEQLVIADYLIRASHGYDYLEMFVKEKAFKSEEDLALVKEIMNDMDECVNFFNWCNGILPTNYVKEQLGTILNIFREHQKSKVS